ncbi:MAG: AEC family transporter [Aquificae bacterium]|nr:AEC family transporter [Aquificota bacterium]
MDVQSRVSFIVLIILSAYLLKRIGVFSDRDAKPFINFVIYFALPSTVLVNLRFVELGSEVFLVVLLAWFSVIFSLLCAFFLGRLSGLEGGSFRAFLLVSSFGNTAFLGYPFVYALEGKEGLAYAIIYDQLGSFLLVITLGLFIAVGRLELRSVITFPPFLALVLSLLLHGYRFPKFLEDFLLVVSSSLIPVILFSLGLRVDMSGLRVRRDVVLALFVKMFLSPLAVLFLLKLLGLSGGVYRVVLIESAMPPMVFSGVLAVRYGLDEKLAFSAIVLGIPVSFLSVPFFAKFV